MTGETTGNFLRTIPFVLVAALPFLYRFNLTKSGVVFAVLSGAIASGIGYSVWYAALKYHTATRAAIVQLSVPVLAAVGGLVYVTSRRELRDVIEDAKIQSQASQRAGSGGSLTKPASN